MISGFYNIFIFISLLFSSFCFGQDSVACRSFSIGSKTAGLGFGDPINYSGIRLNLFDKGSESIKGFSFSFISDNEKMNGLQISGIAFHSKRINGVSLATFIHNSQKINGFAVSFGINCDTLNGVFSGFGIAPGNRVIKGRIINGLAVGVIIGAEKINGVSIALFNSFSKKLTGLSVSACNKTDELHGLQIGLLNYAGNNPRVLRWLPLANFHL